MARKIREVESLHAAGWLLSALAGAALFGACSSPSGGGKPPPGGVGLGGSSVINVPGGGGVGPGAGGSNAMFFEPDSGYHGGATGAGGTPALGAGGSVVLPPPVDQPVVINDCPGSVNAATVQALQAGGAAGGVRILYPYDKTVFPVGLPPPVVQWEQSGGVDAVYVHMKSTLFEYFGCFPGSGGPQLNLPGNPWNTAGSQTKGGSDPLTFEITVMSGGNVIGPIRQTIYFAPGKLKGDLFYNTYTSPQAANNGAVMRLHLGATSPEVLLTDVGIAPFGPCWSCHSLSSRGTVLVAQHHQYPGGPYTSAAFDLAANPGLRPPSINPPAPSAGGEMGLGAVHPDGTKVLTMGSPGDSTVNIIFPDALGNVPAMIGPKPSLLLDTRTGAQLPINGWSVQFAKMPSFSPDGTLVAFNWHEDSLGHSLGIANFDTATNTMSNVRVLYKHASLYPGWPFITPDNKDVVFVLGNAPDYVSSYPARPAVAASDLWTVDIATGNARPLDRANGYPAGGGPTYLPRPGRDEHLQFFPTLSPIAAGGYFWVFFTSRRTYGNIITQDAIDAPTKKIWVSAYNINSGTLIQDPSNPPFYLEGQEAAAGNIRAFAALEPCHADGGTCETGVDCCNGHCYMGSCGLPPDPPPPLPNEPPPPPRCSKLDERCATAADCCDAAASCVGNYCVIIQEPH